MKQNVLLVLFGLILGSVAVGASLSILRPYLKSTAEATHFDSVSGLHKKMLQRDSRDLKKDGSVSLRSILVPEPKIDIMYDLAPNLDVKFQGVSLKTNSCGLRSKEISIQKPKNAYRDSLARRFFCFWLGS